MSYLLKYIPININELKLNRPSISIDCHISFIPTYTLDLLQTYAKNNKEIISKSFVENYFLIVNLLIMAQSTDHKTISSRKLKKIERYKIIIDILSPQFIIYKKNYSTTAQRCYEYVLDLSSESWSFVFIEENTTNICIKRKCTVLIEPVHPSNNPNYIEALSNSEIDICNAVVSETNNYKKKEIDLASRSLKIKTALTKIIAFNNRRFIKKGGEVNRVYNSFTNLSKVSRKHVTLNGVNFTEIDIPNCQPLLLLILLNKIGVIPDNSYLNDVLEGVIYQRIKEKALELGYEKEKVFNKDKFITETFFFNKEMDDNDPKGLDDVKTLTYRSIFFSQKDEKKSITAFVFKELYPLVFDSLKKHFNKGDEPNLAFHLQNLEAEIILNIVPDCPYFTVHDSIAVIDEKEVESIKTQILQKISEYLNRTVNLKLRVKRLVDETDETTSTDAIRSNVRTCPIRIQGKYKTHKRKQVKYDKFKLMCGTYTRAEITVELNISSKTYLRYAEEYNQEQSIPIS